jgi:biotin transport system permease protein
VSLRLAAAVGLANLVTMTTRLDDRTDVVLRLLSPLGRLGIRTAPIGFAMALVIRFTPVLFAKAGTLVDAWRARSPRRPGWQILMPITLLAIDDAEHVAEALRARGGLDTEP